MADEYKLHGVHFIRLIWCDVSGVRRCRVVPARRLKDIRETGIGLANACLFLPSWGDSPPADPATKPVGEIRLMPDVIQGVPWRFSHAMTLVNMHSVPGKTTWQCCPRSVLQRVLDRASKDYGMTVKSGFELEFILLKKPSDTDAHGNNGSANLVPPSLDQSVYCQTSAFEQAAPVLEEMCSHLKDLGISIDQLHPESAPGQFELALHYSDAMQAADNVVLAKEVISAVAAKHNLIVSFLPKLFANQAGNGMHCHISIYKDDVNVMDLKTGSLGSQFLAGILHNLPALMPFTCPSPNSYRRVAPSTWSGAYQCWGFNNREAPLRLVHLPEEFNSANLEVKTFDASANPHLGLAAVIVAGLFGVNKTLTLPEQVNIDPATLTPMELEQRQITRLPVNLKEAMEALKSNTEYYAALEEGFESKDLVRAHLAVRQSEWEFFKDMNLEEEAGILYARY